MNPSHRLPIETLLAHTDFVRSLAATLVRDAATADEVVQRTWLEACQRPPTDLRSPRGWLATVAGNAARKLLRGEDRRRVREETAATPEGLPSTAALAEREEARRALVDAVLALDEPYQTAVVLRFFEGLPPREIARRLAVPVDTVNTRIRRGLSRLRMRLDDRFAGGRSSWAIALIPLAAPRTATGAGMSAVAACVAIGTTVVLAWVFVADRPADPPSTTVVTAPAPPSSILGRLPPPVAPHREASAPGIVVELRSTPARSDPDASPVAPTPSEGQGRLALVASVDPAYVPDGSPVQLSAVFRHDGGPLVTLFTPWYLSLDPFPTWRLIHQDGRVFRPAPRQAQTMWTAGLMGDLRRIEPEKAWSHSFRASEFLLESDDAHADGVPLPPGRYVVRCSHEQGKDLPHARPGFVTEYLPVDGVWTGRVTAAEQWLEVLPPDSPRITLTQVVEAVAGDPCPLRLEIVNHGKTELVIDEGFDVRVVSKAVERRIGRLTPDRLCDSQGRTNMQRVAIAAGATESFTFDLTAIPLYRESGDGPPIGLPELLAAGLAMVEVEPRRKDGDVVAVEAVTASVRVTSRLVAQAPEMECRLTRVGGSRVRVEVVNNTPSVRRVCTRLEWPRELRLKLEDPARPGDGVVDVGFGTFSAGPDVLPLPHLPPLSGGLTWSGDHFEWSGPITASDFRDLAPGASFGRELDLSECVHGGLSPGSYRVVATWYGVHTGRHLDVTPPADPLVVESSPMTLGVE